MVPVIPFAIETRVGIPSGDVGHWVSVLLGVYGGALLVAAPISGVMADRWLRSRQVPLLGGLFILLGSTIMFCLGQSIPVLIVARILQGASAGVVWTVALALLSDTVGKDQSGRALGFVAASYSVGTLIAPMLGGIVYREGGYYEVFYMMFALIAVDIILRLLIIEKHRAAKWLAVEGEMAIEGSDEERQLPANPAHTPEPIQGRLGRPAAEMEKAGAPTVSVPTASKRKLPVMLVLLKSRRLEAAFVGTFMVSTTMAAFDSTLPLFVSRVFHWDALGAGLIFIALLLPHLAGPWIGHGVDKYGPRWIATAGFILLLPFWVLLRLVDHDSIRQKVLLNSLLCGVGLASALIITSLMTEFSKVCDGKEKQDPSLFGGRSAYATSYGIFNVAWAAGSLVGPLMAAALERNEGWKTMTLVFGVLSAVCAIPVVLWSGGIITRRQAAGRPRGCHSVTEHETS